MPLRILIADTYYNGFLDDYHNKHTDLDELSYARRHAHLMAERFGTGDSYGEELRRLGCEAETVVLNANPLQCQWASEHGVSVEGDGCRWQWDIFVAQVRSFRPDILYIQEQSIANDDVLEMVKPFVGAIVGQIACSLPSKKTFRCHDVIISSWPPIVEHFRKTGKRAESLKLGFDRGAIDSVQCEQPGMHGVTFVGGLSPVHRDRIALLETLCERVPISIFGYGIETLPSHSVIRRHHRGSAWGLDFYRTLAGSSMTVNAHGSIVVGGETITNLANNSRLYEATGMGPLLVTDDKCNLSDIFEPDREVITYRTVDECVEKILYYLEHEDARRDIASAGQRRTLSTHTYAHRMEELLGILESVVCARC